MSNAVNISSLQRAAVTYNPVLQMLPFTTLAEPLAALGINLLDVLNGKDTIIGFHRKGGLSRPYTATTSDAEPLADEIGKMIERDLEVKKCVLVFKDHIANYDAKIAVNGQLSADNQAKKHPLERIILESILKTVAEDIIDAMYHAKRDASDLTPMGMFDGFNELIDTDITAGTIASANGNLITSGALTAPATGSDTTAIDNLIKFIRACHPALRKNGILQITPSAKNAALDALENKTAYKSIMTIDMMQSYLQDKCDAPNMKLVSDPCLGTGSRLVMTKPGNFDLGMRTKTDKEFIQVRDAYVDPNWVQFWNQFDAGARIRSVHAKEFAVNEQSNTAVELSGDYQS